MLAAAVTGPALPRLGQAVVSPKLAFHYKDKHEFGAIAFDPGSRWLAVGYLGGYVRLWETATWREKPTLGKVQSVETGGLVQGVAFSSDGRRLAVANGSIQIWDARSWKKLRRFQGLSASLQVAISSDLRLIAGEGTLEDFQKVLLSRLATGSVAYPLVGHSDGIWFVTFSEDGRWLASASFDHTAILWDVATRKKVFTLTGHADEVTTVAFSSDGRFLASGSKDGTAKVWDVATGQLVGTFSDQPAEVWAVAFSPDGKWLGTGCNDETVTTWEVKTGRKVFELSCPSNADTLAFSPDGRWLAVGGGAGKLYVWDLQGEH